MAQEGEHLPYKREAMFKPLYCQKKTQTLINMNCRTGLPCLGEQCLMPSHPV
jgi:hypothetical protein